MNGKNKGSEWERKLCKKLSLWWTEGTRDDVFWRTSNSGGRATFRNKRGKQTSQHCGDICAIDPVGEPLLKSVVIEAKKGYNRVSVQDLLDKPEKGALQAYELWFNQAEEERRNRGCPFWLVIHARDRRRPLVFLPRPMFQSFILPHFPNQVILYWNKEEIIGCRLDDFLEAISPSEFLVAANPLEFLSPDGNLKVCQRCEGKGQIELTTMELVGGIYQEVVRGYDCCPKCKGVDRLNHARKTTTGKLPMP